MRLTILLASVALATPALAVGPGNPHPRGAPPRGIPISKLPHLNYGAKPAHPAHPAQPTHPSHPAKPPKLVYQPVPPAWKGPPKGTPVVHLPHINYGQKNHANANAGANAAATAGATAGANATATGGMATATGGMATASNSNANNADNSSNLSSNVRVEGDTYIHREARNRRIPVSTAYAAPLTSGIDTCLGSASGGVQTPIVGVSLGGTKRDRICETIKLSRELHHMGMREGAVQLLCIDERVRMAMRNAGTPCEAVTYEAPMAFDEPPPPPPPVHHLPPPKPRRGERG